MQRRTPKDVTVFAINHKPRGKKGLEKETQPRQRRSRAESQRRRVMHEQGTVRFCTKASSEGHAVKREGRVENNKFDLD